MPRTAVFTRQATLDDVDTLVEFWTDLSSSTGRARVVQRELAPTAATERLRELICDPDTRVVLAVVDDKPVGMAVLTMTSLGPLSDVRAVHLSHLVVSECQRHRGAGRALVAAAADFAEEAGSDEVVVSIYPGLRDAHRFYARLGFVPLMVRRAAPVNLLRRTVRLPEPVRTGAVRGLTRRRRPYLVGRTAGRVRPSI
jgi:GNAT superfamily N-acetyltransferase